MSRQLLEVLNGDNDGSFRAWLDAFEGAPRIAWYPGSNTDLWDFWFFTGQLVHGCESDVLPKRPDIYLHTTLDWYPGEAGESIIDSILSHLKSDNIARLIKARTFGQAERSNLENLEVLSVEPLPRLDLPVHDELRHGREVDETTGAAWFIRLSVQFDRDQEAIEIPLIHQIMEAATFYAEVMRPANARCTHVCKKNYGGYGWGGFTGQWVANIAESLGCECMVFDDFNEGMDCQEIIRGIYPESTGPYDSFIRPEDYPEIFVHASVLDMQVNQGLDCYLLHNWPVLHRGRQLEREIESVVQTLGGREKLNSMFELCVKALTGKVERTQEIKAIMSLVEQYSEICEDIDYLKYLSVIGRNFPHEETG